MNLDLTSTFSYDLKNHKNANLVNGCVRNAWDDLNLPSRKIYCATISFWTIDKMNMHTSISFWTSVSHAD